MSDTAPTTPTFSGFDLLAEVGTTPYGKIFQAQQRNPPRVVRLLILEPSVTANEDYVTQFVLRAKTAAGIKHGSLPEVYDAAMGDGLYYLSGEWIEGQSVADWMAAAGAMPEPTALQIALGCADALKAAWDQAQLPHGNLSVANIVIQADGALKLMDFALAKKGAANRLADVRGVQLHARFLPQMPHPKIARGRKEFPDDALRRRDFPHELPAQPDAERDARRQARRRRPVPDCESQFARQSPDHPLVEAGFSQRMSNACFPRGLDSGPDIPRVIKLEPVHNPRQAFLPGRFGQPGEKVPPAVVATVAGIGQILVPLEFSGRNLDQAGADLAGCLPRADELFRRLAGRNAHRSQGSRSQLIGRDLEQERRVDPARVRHQRAPQLLHRFSQPRFGRDLFLVHRVPILPSLS